MTSEYTNQMTAQLLLLSLMSVLAIVILLTFAIAAYLRKLRLKRRQNTAPHEESLPRPKYLPHAFENPCRWLAVKSSSLVAVQSALRLNNPVRCTWGEGMTLLSQHHLFVSPPIQGWILVLGQGLPEPSEDIEACFHLVTRLSRDLGVVQFFSAHRAINHHAWVQADHGKIKRAYAWAGETLWNQGPTTDAERDLGMQCFDYGEGPGSVGFSVREAHQSNSDKVLFLAARWSLDPSTIGETVAPSGHGVVGDVNHHKLH